MTPNLCERCGRLGHAANDCGTTLVVSDAPDFRALLPTVAWDLACEAMSLACQEGGDYDDFLDAALHALHGDGALSIEHRVSNKHGECVMTSEDIQEYDPEWDWVSWYDNEEPQDGPHRVEVRCVSRWTTETEQTP